MVREPLAIIDPDWLSNVTSVHNELTEVVVHRFESRKQGSSSDMENAKNDGPIAAAKGSDDTENAQIDVKKSDKTEDTKFMQTKVYQCAEPVRDIYV